MKDNIINLFEETVKKYHDTTCVIFNNKNITYNEINIKINRFSRYILDKINKKKMIIPIIIDHSLNMIIGIYAILKCGCAYVPLSPDYPDKRIDILLKKLDSNFIVTSNSIYNNKKILKKMKPLFIDNNYNEFDKKNLNIVIDNKSLCYVMFTSGSTGIPKGVMIQHESLTNYILYFIKKSKMSHSKIHIFSQNYCFDGSTKNIFTCFLSGSTILLIPPKIFTTFENFNNIYKHINIYSVFSSAPLLQSFLKFNTNFKCKLIYLGGTKLSYTDVVKIKNHCDVLINGYGPTEATICVSDFEIGLNDEIPKKIPIGKPIDNVLIYLLDDNLKKVPKNTKGEIYISGICLSTGYFKDKNKTKKYFINNPFYDGENEYTKKMYKTGDIAMYDNTENLIYINRIDDQIKINGQRVEIGEIENVINNLEMIEKCVVLHNNVNSKTLIYSFLKINKNSSDIKFLINKNKNIFENNVYNFVITKLKESLPIYMIPIYFKLVDNFKLNTSGKIDKKELPSIEIIRKEYLDLHTNINENIDINILDIIKYEISQLININIDDISLYENLTYLGITSINLIQLQSKLEINGYFIEPDILIKCTNIIDLVNGLKKIEKNNNITNNTFNLFRKDYLKNNKKYNIYEKNINNINVNNNIIDNKLDNIHEINSIDNNIISNFFDKNIIFKKNDLLKLDTNLNNLIKSNNTYNVLYRGSCGVQQIIEYYNAFSKKNILNILPDFPERGFQQSSLYYLFQNVTNKQVEEIKQDSNNLINEFSFNIDSNEKDILIIHTEDTIKSNNIMHKNTKIFVSGSMPDIKSLDKTKFTNYLGKNSLDLFESLIEKFINKYKNKIIIFINRLELDDKTMDYFKKNKEDRYSDLLRYKEMNLILNSISDKYNNVYILDVRKYIKSHSDIIDYHPGHIKPHCVLNISNYMNKLLDIIYNNKFNTVINISNTLININDINNFDSCNFKLLYLNEGNKNLSILIKFNSLINNEKLSGTGITFDLDFKFTQYYISDIHFTDALTEKFTKKLPIKKYKITFFARQNKNNDNFRFKIYTGIKYLIIEKKVSTKYEKFELEEIFNFTSSSPVRIGFVNPSHSSLVIINSPEIKHIV